MRREGFEVSISRPRVLFKHDPATGARLEPIEEVVIDVDDGFTGVVIERLSARKGEMLDMRPSGGGKTRLNFLVAFARAHRLPGRVPDRHARHRRAAPPVPRLRALQGPHRRPPQRRAGLERRRRRRALCVVESRGARRPMFIDPGERIYQGMIIGENSRGNDLEVNPMKAQAAHQHPRRRQGGGRAPDAAARDDARAGDRLYRR